MSEKQVENGQVTEVESLREQLRAEQRKNVETEQRLRATESAELEARRILTPYLVREIEILRNSSDSEAKETSDD